MLADNIGKSMLEYEYDLADSTRLLCNPAARDLKGRTADKRAWCADIYVSIPVSFQLAERKSLHRSVVQQTAPQP